MSHGFLHKAWRSLEDDVPTILQVVRSAKKNFHVNRVLAWLDGWVIKTRQRKGAEVIRNTLRVAVAQFKVDSLIIWKATCGFLECSYQELYRRLIPKSLDADTVVLCDGESALEFGFTDNPLEHGKNLLVDHDTGEVLESLIVVGVIQCCLFHLGYNIIQKARTDGMNKNAAEELSENLKKISYLPCKTMRAIQRHWKEVVFQRINVLHWLCDDLASRQYQKTAASIRRAIPHVFTYVRYFCQYGFFTGRTTNKLENMFRHATYRLKRIGAIWSPKGAKQMLMFILAQHLKYPLKFSTVKPLSFHIQCGVVKR